MTEIDNELGEYITSGHSDGLPDKLTRKYSELPQRPIRLKADIGGLAGPGRKSVDKAETAKPSIQNPLPPQLRPAKKPRKPTTQWTLKGISPGTRDAAVQAAKTQGIPVGQWVDQAIRQSLTAGTNPSDSQQQVLDALGDIQARLERIERFPTWWERLKDFLRTCVEYGRSG
jgi:predicted HicB family RNase H-like nuclease